MSVSEKIGLDDFVSTAPAENLMVAKNRYLLGNQVEGFDEGVCATDFLALCDKQGIHVDKAMRDYIESICLKISRNTLETRATKQKLKSGIWTLQESLATSLLGIVPEHQLRLKIDLIPKPLFGRNLRKALGQTRWSALRKQVLDERGHVCEICGAHPNKTSELHAHEEWKYDLVKRPARTTLIRIGLICNLCHAVEHIGNSVAQVNEQKMPESYLDQLVAHFCAVNGVSIHMWESHFHASWMKWEKRSKRLSWRVEFGPYDSLLGDVERDAI